MSGVLRLREPGLDFLSEGDMGGLKIALLAGSECSGWMTNDATTSVLFIRDRFCFTLLNAAT